MAKVFISYRREDAAGYAQAIYGQLERRLERDHIFMDVDTLEPGVDFVSRIQQAIGESEVLIVLIGKRWMGERENAPPRIHDPHDFVHLELAAGLARDIRIIPILVDGARMPNRDQLPPTLEPLVRRNAVELSNTRFRFDLERVSNAVRKALGPPRITTPVRWQRHWRWYAGFSIFLIALAIAAGIMVKDKQPTKVEEFRQGQDDLAVLKRQVADAERDAESAAEQLDELRNFRSQQAKPGKELDAEIIKLEENLKALKKNRTGLQDTDSDKREIDELTARLKGLLEKRKETLNTKLKKIQAEISGVQREGPVSDKTTKDRLERLQSLRQETDHQLEILQNR